MEPRALDGDGRMRIIAGQRRGHKFDGPKGDLTRPTSDLVRESIFNILGPSIEGLTVVDLFAGTGALGLEALSRGAARAIFVERDREAVALIYRNVATLRYEDRAKVMLTDAYRFARGLVGDPEGGPLVVFIDPPYREYEHRKKQVCAMLAGLAAQLPDGSTLVVESSRTLDDQTLPELDRWNVRRYGGTLVAILTLGEDEPDEPAEDEVPGEPAES